MVKKYTSTTINRALNVEKTLKFTSGSGDREKQLMSYCEVVAGRFFEMGQKVRTPCTMCMNMAHNACGEMRSLVGVSVCTCIFLHTCSAKCSFFSVQNNVSH